MVIRLGKMVAYLEALLPKSHDILTKGIARLFQKLKPLHLHNQNAYSHQTLWGGDMQ